MTSLKSVVVKDEEKVSSLAEYLPSDLKEVLEEKLKAESKKNLEETAERIMDVLRLADREKNQVLEEYRKLKALLNEKLSFVRSIEEALSAIKEKNDYRKLSVIYWRHFDLTQEERLKLHEAIRNEESKSPIKNSRKNK